MAYTSYTAPTAPSVKAKTLTPYELQEEARQAGQYDYHVSKRVLRTDFWYLIGFFLDSNNMYALDARRQIIELVCILSDPDTVPKEVRQGYL